MQLMSNYNCKFCPVQETDKLTKIQSYCLASVLKDVGGLLVPLLEAVGQGPGPNVIKLFLSVI
jgi:hypothetical protein